MTSGGAGNDDKPLDELFAQLLDDGKAYAQAEFRLARATAEVRIAERLGAARKTALLAAGALLFLIAGVVVLAVTLATSLATLVGPLAGGLIATVVTLGIAALLGLAAKKAYEASS